MSIRRIALLGAAGALALGCGQREEVWDAPLGESFLEAHSMRSSAALVDLTGERIVFVKADGAESLSFSEVPAGHGLAASRPTKDGEKLVMLSRGDVPRRRADDEGPSLQVVDPLASPPAVTRYDLADPLSGLEIDPTGEYAVIYPGAGDSSFIQNPNELQLVRLNEPPSASNPIPATLRSFGGRPEGFTFTPTLELPGGPRRLLVVRTDRDVALVDLSAPSRPEVTVKLTAGAAAPRPVGVAVTDGEPGDDSDARVAIRLEQDASVILLDMLPTPADKVETSPHAFLPVPNVIDVGGVPADMTFGRTDGGLRLLALVPSKQALVLVEPATGVAQSVDLGASFDHMSLVTDIVGETADGSDVALLWSSSSPSIAFVALGVTVGKPYKSVERVTLEQPVGSVIDVPAPNDDLKVLASAGGQSFIVLNLVARTASPLLSSVTGTQVMASRDGERLWMYSPYSTSLAVVGLETLHPQNLLLNYPISRTFEIERKDGGRALLALTMQGSMAVTLLDAESPSVESATEYLGILLGDYRK
jgi:hypothetical protein